VELVRRSGVPISTLIGTEDLVLPSANPPDDLAVLRQPGRLVLRGAWLDAEELARLRERSLADAPEPPAP
jgi:hypothetical protein